MECMKDKMELVEYRGIKIYYRSLQYKKVPENYKKTEEDIELINKGLLEIYPCSYDINEFKAQYVNWYDNGIEYTITNMAYDEWDKNSTISMAKKVIG